MNNLISREAVETAIKRYFHGLIDKHIFDIDVVDCAKEVSEAIDSVPIAYDVDKVAGQLESLKSNKGFGGTIQTMYADIKIDDAIEIVKRGGKDE